MNWICLHRPPVMQGHKFFKCRQSGRVAIADWSGDLPHQTDDGVLWLDHSRPMRVEVSSNQMIHVFMPLLKESGEETMTITNLKTALFAVKELGLRVETDSPIIHTLIDLFKETA